MDRGQIEAVTTDNLWTGDKLRLSRQETIYLWIVDDIIIAIIMLYNYILYLWLSRQDNRWTMDELRLSCQETRTLLVDSRRQMD